MDTVVFGTSNCIIRDGFLKQFRIYSGSIVENKSIGGCTSAVGLYSFEEIAGRAFDFAILDYEINDHQAVDKEFIGLERIERNFRNLIAALRLKGITPIILALPSAGYLTKVSSLEALQERIGEDLKVPYWNVSAAFREAVKKGATRAHLMRDHAHMSIPMTVPVGRAIAECVAEMQTARSEQITQTISVSETRRVMASDLVDASKIVERKSSLRGTRCALLRTGDELRIPVGADEVLSGIMIDTGAKGAVCTFSGAGPTAAKRLIMRWNDATPDHFSLMYVDLFQEVSGGPDGVTMRVEPETVEPTEQMLHGRSALPGRYGEVHVEGFLITKKQLRPVEVPATIYHGLPLNLAAFPSQAGLDEALIQAALEAA